MVILRATRAVLRHLPKTSEPNASSDTALGDWYVKRLVVDRQPLLLLASSASLLSIVVRARDVRSLPDRLPDLVAGRLGRLGVPQGQVDAEAAAMSPVVVAKTSDRSVLGVLVDLGKMTPYILEPGWDDSDFRLVEWELAQNPCYAGRPFEEVIFPERTAPELLNARWGAG